jgi:hypothetical protein
LRHGDDQTVDQSQPNAELVGELRARVEDLREQLAEEREARRRADTIIAQLARANEEQARTIRELEAPSEPPSEERETPQTVEEPEGAEPPPSRGPEPSETVDEEPPKAEPHPTAAEAEEGVRRPWWRRILGR